MLGSLTPKTVKRTVENAPRLTDFPTHSISPQVQLADLMVNYSLIIRYCRHYLFATRLLLDTTGTEFRSARLISRSRESCLRRVTAGAFIGVIVFGHPKGLRDAREDVADSERKSRS